VNRVKPIEPSVVAGRCGGILDAGATRVGVEGALSPLLEVYPTALAM
jgi:hypothetical protein